MSEIVCTGARLNCSFGAAPASLVVPPRHRTLSGMGSVATIMDNKPMVNIPPFGMCKAPTNPAVIAATSAASGVFTQAPCVPATAAPWIPAPGPPPTVMVGGEPVLYKGCMCMCQWAGQITVTDPNSVRTEVY